MNHLCKTGELQKQIISLQFWHSRMLAPYFTLLFDAFAGKLSSAFSVSSKPGAIFQDVTLPRKPNISDRMEEKKCVGKLMSSIEFQYKNGNRR